MSTVALQIQPAPEVGCSVGGGVPTRDSASEPASGVPCRTNGGRVTGLFRRVCSTDRGDAEEDDNCPVESDDVGVGQRAHAVTKS